MILTPKYLRGYAEPLENKGKRLAVKIKCVCKCDKFLVLKNIPKKSFDKDLFYENDNWYKTIERGYPFPPDDNYRMSEHYFWQKKFFEQDGWYLRIYRAKDLHENKYDHANTVPIKEFFFNYDRPNDELPINPHDPRLQESDYTVIIKAVCANCGKEYLLFDNRTHGNDAADFEPEKLDEYAFKKKKIGNADEPVELLMAIKNFWDFDDIESNGNEGLTADDYSEMYG